MNSETNAIFVTGGSGFVGREIIRALIEQGCEVRALVRSAPSGQQVSALGAVPVFGDLSNTTALSAAMNGCSTVFHSAAIVADWGQRRDFELVNVQGTKNILAAAKEAGVKTLVHISTEGVLSGGAPIHNADETAPYPTHPTGLYPWSKGLAERAVVAANHEGLRTVVVRPRMVWGKGDTSLLPKLIEVMRQGQWIWFGGGHHLTSTCHVRNVVEGTLLAAEKGEGGQIYHLTDGPPVDFRDFLTAMTQTQGVTPPTRSAPMWLAELLAWAGESLWTWLKLSGRPPATRTAVNLFFSEVTIQDRKARERLGYQAKVTIQAGLDEMRVSRG